MGSATVDVREVFADAALPLICAPMTTVSSPELAAASCAAGVIGSFPTSSPPEGELDDWFVRALEGARQLCAGGEQEPAPLLANLIVHPKRNRDVQGHLESILRHDVPLVITSVGDPAGVIPALHDAGRVVLSDVASLHHAHHAVAAGADGLVLLSAGAGGYTGWANPLAFVRAVRRFYDGPLVIAGGIADGAALWSAITLGYDAALMGTRFIATDESAAWPEWKASVVSSSMDDVELKTLGGLSTSTIAAGGSAGHTVSCVDRQLPAAAVIAEIRAEYASAQDRTRSLLGAARA